MEKNKNIIIILFGIIFLSVGIFMFFKTQNVAKECTEETIATVVDIIEEEDYDSETGYSYSYYPVFEYKIREDNVITQKYNVGSSPSKYNVNDEVTILYNPEKVDSFVVKGESIPLIMTIVFSVAGLAIAIYGVFLQIKSLKTV